MVKRIIMACGMVLIVFMTALFIMEYINSSPAAILGKLPPQKISAASGKLLPKEGEKLSYIMKYLWIIPVAVAEIEIGEKGNYRNHRIYPLTAKAGVSKFISTFIKAEGAIKSYVDVKKLHPWRYEEKSHAEGHRPSDKVIFYYQDAHIMEFKDIKRKIPANTQDPLSALFYLRWHDYEKTKNMAFNVNSNKENYTLETKFLRKERTKFGRDSKGLLVLQSNIRSPKKYSKSEAKIVTYVTNDALRLPILLKIRTKFGPLNIRLTNAEYR